MKYDLIVGFFSKLIKKINKAQVIFKNGDEKQDQRKVYNKLTPYERHDLLHDIYNELPKVIEDEKKYLIERYKAGNTYSPSKLNSIIDKCAPHIEGNELYDYKEKPVVKGFSYFERKEREKLSEKAREKYLTTVAKLSANNSVLDFTLSNTEFNRQMQAFCRPNDLNYNKIVDAYNLMTNRSPESYKERKEYVENRVKSLMNLARELSKPMSDAEFVEKFGDRISDIAALGEFQKDNFEMVLQRFGVTVEPEVLEEWKEMGNFMVTAAYQINRFGIISSPQYALTSVRETRDAARYLEQLQMEEHILKENGFYVLSDIIDTSTKYEAYKTDPEMTEEKLNKGFDNLKVYYDTTNILLAESTVISKDVDYLSIRLIENFGFKEFKKFTYQDLDGNTVSIRDAVKLSQEGKRFMVCDENGNFKCMYSKNIATNEWSGIKDAVEQDTIYFNKYTADENIKESLNKLLEDANSATHFYMKSSQEYKDLRTSISNLINSDLSDREAVETGLKDIQSKSLAYIKSKEVPGVSITSRTEPRLAAAERIFATIKNSFEVERQRVANDEVIKKENSSKQVELNSKLDEDFNVKVNPQNEIENVEKSNEKVSEESKDEINNNVSEESKNEVTELS